MNTIKNNNENKVFIINFISTFLIKGLAFLLSPFYTRMILPEQYSNITLFESYTSIISCFAGLGVTAAVSIAKYKLGEKYDQFKYSNLFFGLIINIVISIVLLILRFSLNFIVSFSFSLFICMIIEVFSMYVINYIHNIYIFEKKPYKNLIFSLIISIFSSILSISLVLYLSNEIKYMGKIYGNVIVCFVISIIIIIIIYILNKKKIKFEKKYINFALLIGIPEVFHLLSGSILSAIDKIMMKNINIESSIIGLYGVMFSFSSVFLIIIDTFNNSWVPFYYDYLNEENKDIEKKCLNYTELITVLACGFMLLSREVGFVFYGSDYHSGLSIIPILVAGIYFIFLYRFYANYEFYHKKNVFIALSTFISGLLNILLNIYLLPKYKMIGAAISSLISYIFLFMINYFYSSKYINQKIPIKISKFLPYILLVFLCMFLCIKIDQWTIKWIAGVIIGLYELNKILKRKTIY